MNIDQILIAVLSALWLVTCGLSAVIFKSIDRKIEAKVDKEIYNVGQVSLIQDVRELKKSLDQIRLTLDQIKLSLASAEGARIERERQLSGAQ